MKKVIFKIIITALVLSTSSFASIVESDTKSLVAIEGSYNSFDVANDASFSEKVIHGALGFKVGAQTDDYRIFISARSNFIPNCDNAYSMGAEAQYVMNFSSKANIFLGLNAGYLKFELEDEANLIRKISTKYYGGDIGVNLHLSEVLDLEIGAKVIKLRDPSHLQSAITYNFGNITTIYMSIIFKYDTDKFY